jgi:hypothetical protein
MPPTLARGAQRAGDRRSETGAASARQSARYLTDSPLCVRAAPAMVGVGLLATFFVVEGRLRQGEAARSLHAGESDRGTTRGIAASFVTATVVGPALARSRRGRCPVAVGWVGVALMLAGLSLRLWSARILGGQYTANVAGWRGPSDRQGWSVRAGETSRICGIALDVVRVRVRLDQRARDRRDHGAHACGVRAEHRS